MKISKSMLVSKKGLTAEEMRVKLIGAVCRADVLFAKRFPEGSRAMVSLESKLEGITPRFFFERHGFLECSLHHDDGMGMVLDLHQAPNEKILTCLRALDALYARAEEEERVLTEGFAEVEQVLAALEQRAEASLAAETAKKPAAPARKKRRAGGARKA